jgi:hypothetical protein
VCWKRDPEESVEDKTFDSVLQFPEPTPSAKIYGEKSHSHEQPSDDGNGEEKAPMDDYPGGRGMLSMNSLKNIALSNLSSAQAAMRTRLQSSTPEEDPMPRPSERRSVKAFWSPTPNRHRVSDSQLPLNTENLSEEKIAMDERGAEVEAGFGDDVLANGPDGNTKLQQVPKSSIYYAPVERSFRFTGSKLDDSLLGKSGKGLKLEMETSLQECEDADEIEERMGRDGGLFQSGQLTEVRSIVCRRCRLIMPLRTLSRKSACATSMCDRWCRFIIAISFRYIIVTDCFACLCAFLLD